MYAVIKTGGKQYKVSQGDVIYIEKLDQEAGDKTNFEVVAINDGSLKIGDEVKNASVSAKVIKNGRAKKITVFTYKAKKGQKRKMGHRQSYTKVEIESINA